MSVSVATVNTTPVRTIDPPLPAAPKLVDVKGVRPLSPVEVADLIRAHDPALADSVLRYFATNKDEDFQLYAMEPAQYTIIISNHAQMLRYTTDLRGVVRYYRAMNK